MDKKYSVYLYTVKYYSAPKKSELMSFARKMQLEIIMLNEPEAGSQCKNRDMKIEWGLFGGRREAIGARGRPRKVLWGDLCIT